MSSPKKEGGAPPADPRRSYHPERTAVMGTTAFPDLVEEAPKPPALERDTKGRVELTRVLGRGGLGEVWAGVQGSLERPVAVKRLRADLAAGLPPAEVRGLARMLREEAFTTAHLEHPNVVPVHELLEDARGLPLFAMKLVKGRPWDERIAADFVSLPVPDFLGAHLPILVQVGQAVAFAHSRGIIHRDLKPSQVMVGEFGEVLLMDWGLAVSTAGADAPADREVSRLAPPVTLASSPAGTFAFMAPEQTADTAKGVGVWTDVYLLGGTLYYLLTGRLPHPGPTSAEAFEQARRGWVAAPSESAPDREIPADLVAICDRAMAARPEDRLPSAASFVKAISDWLAGAGRRREADSIVRDVEVQLPQGRESYGILAMCDAALARAQGLWGSHPRAAALHQEVIVAWARAALSHGDLVLARTQGERLAEGPARQELLGSIGAREEARRRRERQLRVLKAATVATATALFLVAAGWGVAQRQAARRLAAERDRADAARRDSEELVSYMLVDLRDKLRPVGRLDLLDDPARRALAYFDSLPASDRAPGALGRSARALKQIAEVQLERRDLAAARRTLNEALTRLDSLLAADPKNTDWVRDRADALRLRGTIRRTEGDPRGALADYQSAESVFAGLVAASPRDPALLRQLFQARNHVAIGLRLLELNAAALDELSRAREALARLLELEPGNLRWRHALSESLNLTAQVHLASGDVEAALREHARAAGEMEGLVTRDPQNALFAAYLGRTLAMQAKALRSAGREDEAREKAGRARQIFGELVAKDPGNATWKAELEAAERPPLHRP